MKSFIDKSKYLDFCQKLTYVPIFNTPQWLHSVSDNWDAVVVTNEDGNVIAGFPYHLKRVLFFTAISMPKLTPYFKILIEKDYLTEEEKLTSKIIEALPHCQYTSLILHPSMKNYLPWKWQDYHVSSRYTFYLDTKKKYEETIKGHLRYALKKMSLILYYDIDQHYKLVCESFEAQNLKAPLSLSQLKKIYKNNASNQLLLKCVDSENITQASLFIVFDDHFCYNISSGRSRNAQRGAITYLTDYAIEWSNSKNKKFDFEGSSIESIYKFYAPFGGDLTQHFRVTKSSNKLIRFLVSITNRI